MCSNTCCHVKITCLYTASQKKQDTKFLPITSPNINRFSNFFTDGLRSKFATNSCLNIPPCLKRVATLPCEIWMSEKWCQVETCIVINDKSQGSIAKHLMSNELLYYAFITLSAGERIFYLKLVNISRSYRQNGWLFNVPHSTCTFVVKDLTR